MRLSAHPHRPAQCTVPTGWCPCSTAPSWSWVPASCFSLELPPGSPSQVTLLWKLEEPGWTAGCPSRLSGVPSRRRPRAHTLRRASSPGDHGLSPLPAWRTWHVRAPSLRTPCSPPPPAAALGLPGGSSRGGGCAGRCCLEPRMLSLRPDSQPRGRPPGGRVTGRVWDRPRLGSSAPSGAGSPFGGLGTEACEGLECQLVSSQDRFHPSGESAFLPTKRG